MKPAPHEYFDWQEHLEPAIKIMIEGIMILDTEGRIMYVNDSAERMLGRDKSDIVGRFFTDPIWDVKTAEGLLFPEEDRPFSRAMREDKPVYGVELSVLRPDGTRSILSFNAIPLRDETGTQIASVETFSDITERKKTEEALKESEERFRSVVESATDAVIGCTKGGTEVSIWNKAAETIFGYTSDEICGQPLAWIIPERYRQGHKEGIRKLTEKGVAGYLGAMEEFVGLRKDGSEFPIEISLGSWTAKEGVSFTAVIRDITERKQVEEEIREHHEELKERDHAIRTAYVDVLGAVTGGKLILMTQEEIEEALALGSPLIEPQTIFSYDELSAVRQTMREAVMKAAPDMDPAKFIVAFSEALTNAVKHSGSGICRLFKVGSTLQIVIADAGAGIDFSNLPKATLMPGYSTKGTLGMGFSIMLEVCDRVLLSTQPGNTTLVLELGA